MWSWYLNEKLSFGRQWLNPTLSSPHLTSKKGNFSSWKFLLRQHPKPTTRKGKGIFFLLFFLDSLYYYFMSCIIESMDSAPNTSLNLMRAEYIRVFAEGSVRWQALLFGLLSLFPPSAPLKLVSSVFLHFLLAYGLLLRGATPLVWLADGGTSEGLQINVNNEFERASLNWYIWIERYAQQCIIQRVCQKNVTLCIDYYDACSRRVCSCLLQVHPILIG